MFLTKDEYRDRIILHNFSVTTGMQRVADELCHKGQHHDKDKLLPEILDDFYPASEKFSGAKYGSEEYRKALSELSPVLSEHYRKNSHHPEHYSNGINGMSLLDLIEMLVDWKSACSAYGDSFETSMEVAKLRFGIGDQLFDILNNTAKFLGYADNKPQEEK
jgi:hypothetical protein